MARKYTVDAELKEKGFTQSAKGIKAQISALEREGKTLQNSFKVTGDFKKLSSGMSSMQKGLRMSEAEVKRLQASLERASKVNLSADGVTKLENELIRARSQAERFKTSLAQMNQQASGTSTGVTKAGGSVKSFASNLLSVGSGFGNIVSGVTAGFNAISGVVQTGAGYVNAFGKSLMDTYDNQIKSQKTLSAVLSDGADGYKVFNSHIESGNLLLKSQKGDLNEIGATLASYTQMSGQRAFDIANSINAVGDSLSVGTEAQKQFSVAIAQAMGAGALHAQDFNQMMQTALGANFKQALIDAANETGNWGTVTQANFKEAMEAGVFSTDVMNRALDGFIKQGQEVANAGPSTFEQVGQMITNAFNTSALDGFKGELKSAGFDFAQFGNDAGEISGVIGQAMGALAGKTANAMLKYVDANGDGKVSNEELGAMADKVSGKVQDFFNNINSKDVQGFVNDMGEVVGALADVIGWIRDAIGWIDDLNNAFPKVKSMQDSLADFGIGKGGILGGLFGYNLASPMTMQGFAGDNTGFQGVAEKVSGSMASKLPFNAQLFAGGSGLNNDVMTALAGVSPNLANMFGKTESKTIIFNQTLNGSKADDGGKEEIIKLLKKNGYKIKFT